MSAHAVVAKPALADSKLLVRVMEELEIVNAYD